MSKTKQITIRIPSELLVRLRVRESQVAPYVIEAVKDKLERDEQAEIASSMSCLADDLEANDISDLAPAQEKVIARGD